MKIRRESKVYLDVTNTLNRSASGIESVVKNLSLQFGESGLLVFQNLEYRNLTKMELIRLGLECEEERDTLHVDLHRNDIIFLPELFSVGSDYLAFLDYSREIGVHVIPFIHDLLPLENPDWFPSHILADFVKYANVLRSFRYTLSNSQRTLETFQIWRHLAETRQFRQIDSTDLVVPLPYVDMDFTCLQGRRFLAPEGRSLSILQVGNFDPRKNLTFTESLVKKLAKDGYQVTLNLVGANVWHIEEWLDHFQHEGLPNLHVNVHLNLSDGQLELLWLQADVVFYFSYAEGFGLPVTEAVFRRIPTLANEDLPVMALCKSPHLWGVNINDFASTYRALLNSIGHKDCTGIQTRLAGKFQLGTAWQNWAETTIQELLKLQFVEASNLNIGKNEN